MRNKKTNNRKIKGSLKKETFSISDKVIIKDVSSSNRLNFDKILSRAIIAVKAWELFEKYFDNTD